MYKISIEALKFSAILGILEHERVSPQEIVVDIKIWYNYQNENFIDYTRVAELIKSTIVEKKFKLIEDALEYLLKKIEKKFPQSNRIELKISKPKIMQECVVSVEIKKNFKKN